MVVGVCGAWCLWFICTPLNMDLGEGGDANSICGFIPPSILRCLKVFLGPSSDPEPVGPYKIQLVWSYLPGEAMTIVSGEHEANRLPGLRNGGECI